MTYSLLQEAFANVCFAYANERSAKLKEQGRKIAHYTSAANGIEILRNRTLWLRNAAVMNDFSEIGHGQRCLDHCLHQTGVGQRLRACLDAAHPGMAARLDASRQSAEQTMHTYTFMMSVSEHDADDHLGRLSMWRAYGGSVAGVALVFNTDVLEADSEALGAYSSPVVYGSINFASEFERFTARLEQSVSLMKALPPDYVHGCVWNAVHFAILSSKHEGFAEEQEWRVIHTPDTDSTPFIEWSPETVGGVPQIVYKIPLENREGMNMPQVEPSNLLHRVIIGPTLYPRNVAEAYAGLLMKLGIQNPWERIVISNIPLRQWG